MEREGARGLYEELHEKLPYHDGTFRNWAEKRSRAFPFKYDEGVTIGVADSDLTPWDHFTTERDATPWQPPESAGDVGEVQQPEQ